MPTNQEFNEALQRVVRFIEDSGDETAGQVDGQTDAGHPLSGYMCQHGNHAVQVVGCPVWDYFLARNTFDLSQLLAAQRATGGNPPDSGEVELTEEQVQDARDELSERLERDEHEELRVELVKATSRPNLAANLMAFDHPGVYGYNIDSKLYLYDDGFELGDFGKEIQSVVSVGWLGKEILLDGYDIREELAFVEEEPTPEIDEGPTAFQ